MFANTALILPAADVAAVRWCNAKPMCHSTISPTPWRYSRHSRAYREGDVLAHLKKSLRGHFNHIAREVKGRYSPRLWRDCAVLRQLKRLSKCPDRTKLRVIRLLKRVLMAAPETQRPHAATCTRQ